MAAEMVKKTTDNLHCNSDVNAKLIEDDADCDGFLTNDDCDDEDSTPPWYQRMETAMELSLLMIVMMQAVPLRSLLKMEIAMVVDC